MDTIDLLEAYEKHVREVCVNLLTYNHGQKYWDTFAFLGRFSIHTGPTPPLTPQAMLDTYIQIFFSSFNFV